MERDAKDWKPKTYWLGIIGVIAIEALINFESFIKISGITPFMATGMTLGTATFIGFAAHLHGIFIRQFTELMGEHTGRGDKNKTLVLQILALFLLLVAMGLVAWGALQLIKRHTFIE